MTPKGCSGGIMSKRLIQKKVCLLGNFAVGKTSLIRRFVEGRFDDTYLSTIGVKISRKTITFPEHDLNLLIWDLAGGDDFGKMGNMYLRGAVGALIVIDLTRPETIDSFHFYSKQLLEINPDATIVLVANKVDLEDERQITKADLTAISEKAGCQFVYTSAKTGFQVEAAFQSLAEGVVI